jgi:hypothetical protein
MRTLSILSAAILGLCASTGFASAQATNVSPYSGGARAYYGGGDVPGQRWRHSRAMARSYWVPGDYYGPRRHYGYYGYYGSRRTDGIPPALYHAGDPQFWQ